MRSLDFLCAFLDFFVCPRITLIQQEPPNVRRLFFLLYCGQSALWAVLLSVCIHRAAQPFRSARVRPVCSGRQKSPVESASAKPPASVWASTATLLT